MVRRGITSGGFSRDRLICGVTLIELLVVMAIAATVATTIAPSFLRGLESARFYAAAREVASALKAARGVALRERRETAVTVDTEAKAYVLDERHVQLDVPGNVTMGLITARNEIVDSSSGSIRFFPDGSSTGGRVALASPQRSLSIEIDWLTGHVKYRE